MHKVPETGTFIAAPLPSPVDATKDDTPRLIFDLPY